jgi:serine/threonine protein kinase
MLMPQTDLHSLGDVVGRYRLLGEMARGGMGIVYLAAAQGPAGFSKLVALKELRPDLVQDEDFLTMFLEEARMAARLNHPNIVQTNDVDESNGRHFIAMEYLEGRSLYHVLKRFQPRGGFPQRMAVSILRDVLSALDYAHELTGFDGKPLGFVHRDISPHNVFLTFDGHTKVIDFGIAKARDSSLETKTGVLKGRANYMAPEQLTRHADRRSDIFSVGAVLFEILSGRRLWQGMGEIEILAALTRGEIPSLAAVRPDTPPALLRVCQQALAARVEDRYATAAEMRDALDQHLWSTGGAPRLRDISDMMLQEYDAERQRMRGLVEASLLRLQSGDSGRLETLHLGDARDAVNDSRRGSGGRSHSQVSFGGGGAGGSMHFNPPRTGEQSQVGIALSSVVRAGGTLPTAEPVLLEPLAPESWTAALKVKSPWLVGLALSVVFVLTTMAVALHHAPDPVPQQPPAPLAGAAAAPAGVGTNQPPPQQQAGSSAPGAAAAAANDARALPRVDDTIVFSMGVTPSTAQIHLDGRLMPSNPFIGHFTRSNVSHRVRATAAGYQTKERLVSFDDNVMIDLSLTPNPAPPPPPSVSSSRGSGSRRESSAPSRRQEPPRVTAAAVSPSLEPPPSAPPPARASGDIPARGQWEGPKRRAIDSNNPYGE